MEIKTKEEFNNWVKENIDEDEKMTNPLFLCHCRFAIDSITGKIFKVPGKIDIPEKSQADTSDYSIYFGPVTLESTVAERFDYWVCSGGYCLPLDPVFSSKNLNLVLDPDNPFDDHIRYFTTIKERDSYVNRFFKENFPKFVKNTEEKLLKERKDLLLQLETINKKLEQAQNATL